MALLVVDYPIASVISSYLPATKDAAWRLDVALKTKTIRYLADVVASGHSPDLPGSVRQALTHAFSEEGLVLYTDEDDDSEDAYEEFDTRDLEELEDEDSDGEFEDEEVNTANLEDLEATDATVPIGDKGHHPPIGLEAFGLPIFCPRGCGEWFDSYWIAFQHVHLFQNSQDLCPISVQEQQQNGGKLLCPWPECNVLMTRKNKATHMLQSKHATSVTQSKCYRCQRYFPDPYKLASHVYRGNCLRTDYRSSLNKKARSTLRPSIGSLWLRLHHPKKLPSTVFHAPLLDFRRGLEKQRGPDAASLLRPTWRCSSTSASGSWHQASALSAYRSENDTVVDGHVLGQNVIPSSTGKALYGI
jgi:hypothetical protein